MRPVSHAAAVMLPFQTSQANSEPHLMKHNVVLLDEEAATVLMPAQAQ